MTFLLVPASMNFAPGGQGEQEAAASCRNVEREGVLAASLVGDQVTRRGEEHVGGHRGADHHVNLHGVHPRLIQQIDDRTGAHVGAADTLALEDMARLDTRMRHDPLVVGVDHPAQFVVGEDIFRKVLSHTRNSCCYLTH